MVKKNFRRCCDVGFNPHQPPPEYVSSAFTLQPQGIAIMWPVHVCRPADLVVAVNRFSRFARLANVSNAQFTSPARYGKTQPCLCRVWCDGVNWTIALNVFRLPTFLSATVWSCRESNSHRRSVCDTDKTVLSCLTWQCELALTQRHADGPRNIDDIFTVRRYASRCTRHGPVSRDGWIMRLCARIILRIIGDLAHNWASPA